MGAIVANVASHDPLGLSPGRKAVVPQLAELELVIAGAIKSGAVETVRLDWARLQPNVLFVNDDRGGWRDPLCTRALSHPRPSMPHHRRAGHELHTLIAHHKRPAPPERGPCWR